MAAKAWVQKGPGRRHDSPRTEGRQPPPSQFHNPYTFVPTPDRVKILGHPFLGDHDPSQLSQAENHSQFWPGRFTGMLHFKMTTLSPLFITSTPEVDTSTKGHKTYKCVDKVPAMAIKGMLRSAYEAITNSRMGVFNKEQHQKRLGYRTAANDALKLVPAIVVADPADPERKKLRLYRGLTEQGEQGRGGKLHAAWLRYYDTRREEDPGRGTDRAALRYESGKLPQHGDRVQVHLVVRTHRSGRFSYYEVDAIRDLNDPRSKPLSGPDVYEGYVCLTGPTISKKHHERVFFEGLGEARELALPRGVEEQYERLVTDYQEIHEGDLAKRSGQPWDYLGPNPGRVQLLVNPLHNCRARTSQACKYPRPQGRGLTRAQIGCFQHFRRPPERPEAQRAGACASCPARASARAVRAA